VPRSKKEWSYTSTPQYAFMAYLFSSQTGQIESSTKQDEQGSQQESEPATHVWMWSNMDSESGSDCRYGTATALKLILSSAAPNLQCLEQVTSIWRLYSRFQKPPPPTQRNDSPKEKGRKELAILTDTPEKKNSVMKRRKQPSKR
jgi:hypothetical protein